MTDNNWNTELRDKIHRFGDTWVRESAIDVIQPDVGMGTMIITRSGDRVYVVKRTPGEVVNGIWPTGENND